MYPPLAAVIQFSMFVGMAGLAILLLSIVSGWAMLSIAYRAKAPPELKWRRFQAADVRRSEIPRIFATRMRDVLSISADDSYVYFRPWKILRFAFKTLAIPISDVDVIVNEQAFVMTHNIGFLRVPYVVLTVDAPTGKWIQQRLGCN